MSTLEIEHGGPLEHFAIDFSSGPGVYELRGSKGTGKSTVLSSVELLIGRKVTLTVTDGELSGEVRGFGVMAPIGGKRRRRGELEAATLPETPYTVEDLVSPPLKDPVAADRHRIKALIALRGVLAEPADYYDLVGGKAALESMLSPEQLKTDDPITLNRFVKEALETQARTHEKARDTAAGKSKAGEDAAAGVDLTQPDDASALQQQYQEAIKTRLELVKQHELADEDNRRRESAKNAIAEAKKASEKLISVSVAESDLHELGRFIEDLQGTIAGLKTELARAEQSLQSAVERKLSAEKSLQAAKSHHEAIAKWQEQLNTPPLPRPTDAEITRAADVVEQCRKAVEYAAIVRRAKDQKKQSERDAEQSRLEDEEANRLRELARGTMDILSKSVDAPGIRVESVNGEPRLIVSHPKRGKTLFAELSDGERVRHVIDAVVSQLPDGKTSLFPLSQRIWQDLPPKDRKEVHKYCEGRGIYAIAAQVTDGEIQCHYYGAKEKVTK